MLAAPAGTTYSSRSREWNGRRREPARADLHQALTGSNARLVASSRSAKTALQNGDVQILLGAEEVVGCAPRQPSRIADFLKAHRFKAAFGKQHLSRIQDRLAAAVRVADPRSVGETAILMKDTTCYTSSKLIVPVRHGDQGPATRAFNGRDPLPERPT